MSRPRPARRRTLPGYELEHRLGEGASSTVWRARQVASMGRPVAVKFVRDATAARAEVAALAALDHPHVVRVFELVEDGDEAAIAMQLAGGGSLAERLRRRGPMAPDEVAEVVGKLAGALTSAHRRGVLHRDVKPGNVLFTADGEPLLSDFGLACSASSVDDGRVRGTEAYLDPTVRAGRAPDEAADVYGLGAVAFEMLTGRAPVAGAWSLDDVPPTVPPVLAAVVARGRAADPAARSAPAAEVADALRAPAPPEAPEPPARVVVHDPTATRDFGPRPPADAEVETPGPRWRWAAVAVGLLLVAAGAALLLHPSPDELRPPGATAAPTVTARHCPAVPAVGPEVLLADVDGDGCEDAIGRHGNLLERDGVRYALGDEGDTALLGDWDCDGVATPGVRRAATGEVHLFPGWAGADRPLPADEVRRDVSPPACDDPPGPARG